MPKWAISPLRAADSSVSAEPCITAPDDIVQLLLAFTSTKAGAVYTGKVPALTFEKRYYR